MQAMICAAIRLKCAAIFGILSVLPIYVFVQVAFSCGVMSYLCAFIEK